MLFVASLAPEPPPASMVSLKDARYQALKNLFGPLVTDVLVPTELVGEGNLPTRGPGLVICNHRSPMDPYLFSAKAKRVVNWVMAPFVSRIPVFGWLARQAGAIAIIPGEAGKSEALMERMVEVLRQGRLVGIFPEGLDAFAHPCSKDAVGDFHGTFVRVALRAGIPDLPIIPCAIYPRAESDLGEMRSDFLGLFDPNEKVFRGKDIQLVGYRDALIVIGKPFTFAPQGDYVHPEDPASESPHQREKVAQLAEFARCRVAQLLDRAAQLEAPLPPQGLPQGA